METKSVFADMSVCVVSSISRSLEQLRETLAANDKGCRVMALLLSRMVDKVTEHVIVTGWCP